MPDRQAVAEGLDVPGHIRTVEDRYPLGQEAPLDDMDARAFGAVYLYRHAREKRRRERLLAVIEGREVVVIDRPASKPAGDSAAEGDTEHIATVTPLRRYSREEYIAMARASLGKEPADGSMTPSGEYGARMAELDHPTPPAAEAGSTRDVIRAYLREQGRAVRKDIIAHHVHATNGKSESAVKQALRRLTLDEEIASEDSRLGVYVWLGEVAYRWVVSLAWRSPESAKLTAAQRKSALQAATYLTNKASHLDYPLP